VGRYHVNQATSVDLRRRRHRSMIIDLEKFLLEERPVGANWRLC
jgi:hypothetical protein